MRDSTMATIVAIARVSQARTDVRRDLIYMSGEVRSMTKLICCRAGKPARLLMIVAVFVIAICSRSSFAQTPSASSASASSVQSDGSAVRQNRRATETPTETGAVTYINRGSGTERRVFVRSMSLLVRGAVVEDKLLKRAEFHQLGFVITRDESSADLILELRHDLFTKYVFTVVDTRTQEVVAGGKLSSLGGTVAGKVAKRFVKEIALVKGP